MANERTRNLLRDNREMAYISKQLVTLKTDVDLSELKITPFVFNKHNALEFVKTELESKSLFEKISKTFPDGDDNIPPAELNFPGNACELHTATHTRTSPEKQQIKFDYKIITNISELDSFLNNVDKILALDTETTGLNQMSDTMVGISLAISKNYGVYIPLRHTSGNSDLFGTSELHPNQITVSELYKKLWPVLTNPKILKIGHNLKYDLHILKIVCFYKKYYFKPFNL